MVSQEALYLGFPYIKPHTNNLLFSTQNTLAEHPGYMQSSCSPKPTQIQKSLTFTPQNCSKTLAT